MPLNWGKLPLVWSIKIGLKLEEWYYVLKLWKLIGFDFLAKKIPFRREMCHMTSCSELSRLSKNKAPPILLEMMRARRRTMRVKWPWQCCPISTRLLDKMRLFPISRLKPKIGLCERLRSAFHWWRAPWWREAFPKKNVTVRYLQWDWRNLLAGMGSRSNSLDNSCYNSKRFLFWLLKMPF